MDNKLVLFLEEIGFVESHSYPSSLVLIKNLRPIYYDKITIHIEEIGINCIEFRCYAQRENPTEKDEKKVALFDDCKYMILCQYEKRRVNLL